MQELENVQGELDILYGAKSSVTARKAEINLDMEAKLTTAADHNVIGISNDQAEDNTSFLSGSPRCSFGVT